LTVRPPPSPPSQPPTPPRTPLSPPQHKSSNSPLPLPAQSSRTSPHTTSWRTSVYESGLQPNSIIGNPRVMIPQNMTTILALAALQDQQKAGGSGSSSPSYGRLYTPCIGVSHHGSLQRRTSA
ncbi:hypothetical protein L9F63_005872, partial [Diploptera punctata]